jgi:hypothetical protein
VVVPSVGEVVLVPFPFSDVAVSKVRPAICLAQDSPSYLRVRFFFLRLGFAAPFRLAPLTGGVCMAWRRASSGERGQRDKRGRR